MHSTIHIELVIEAVWGVLTDASGYEWCISETEILTTGLSEVVSSPRVVHHLTRARYVRQMFLIEGSILKTEGSDS